MDSKEFSLKSFENTISATACIANLMVRIKEFSSRGEFDRVQDLLLERENNIKLDIENLRTKCVSLELQKSKCEEKLQVFKKGSKKEKEKVILMLMDREDECFNKINEKNEVSRLYKELGNLNEQVLESNELVEVHLKEYNFLNEKLRGMEREINTLKGEKLASAVSMKEMRRELSKLKLVNLEASGMLEKLNHQIVAAEVHKMRSSEMKKEMRRKELGLEKTIQKIRLENLEALQKVELKCQNVEACKTIEKLSQGKIEAEKAVEMYIKKLDQIKDITRHKQSAVDPTTEVTDSDDEKNQGRSAKASGGKEDVYCKKVPFFSQMISPNISAPKRKRSSYGKEDNTAITRNSVPFIRCEEKVVAPCNFQKQFWNLDNLSKSDSVYSDGESCSSLRINNMIANMRHQ